MASSIPCNAIFANKGDATPPCGVPRSVAWNTSCSTYPALPPLLDEFPSGNWTNGIAVIFVRDVVECASDIAIEKIYGLARPNKTKKWVLDADIRGAFDNISHEYLCNAIGPVPGRELIKQWRKRRVCRTRGISRNGAWNATRRSRVALIGKYRVAREGGGHWGQVRLPRPTRRKTCGREVCRRFFLLL